MSSFVQIQNLYFTYDNLPKNIIHNVTLSFHEGWTSICGANGAGKTTLCKLIGGQLTAQTGNVHLEGAALSVPQSTDAPPTNSEDFRYDYSKRAIRLRDSLGIEDDFFDRWETLSIGERKRVQIGAAISANSHILLVDEPTNHVDTETREVILKELKKYRGVGILISHDRLLLNHLCDSTVFIDQGHVKIYQAPYDIAKMEEKQGHASRQEEYSRKKKELVRLKSTAQEQAEKVSRTRNKLSKRSIDKKDHDAKDKINRAKVSGADYADGRKSHVLDARVHRSQGELSQIAIKKEYKLGLYFGELKRVSTLRLVSGIIKKHHIEIRHPDINLDPGDKLSITGRNGAGKSTLLKHWITLLNQRDLVYAPQELPEQQRDILSKELALLETDVKGKIMTLVSCFGSDPKSVAAGSTPSPGVWQKIVIAKAIVQGAPMLLLDEPTNHMDLPALEVLEEALQLYKGIMIVISHDSDFVKSICNKNLRFNTETNHREAVLSDL